MDDDKDPLSPVRRLTSYSASQEIIRNRPGTLLLFDEVEDVFPWVQGDDGQPLRKRGGGSVDRNKGWLTEMLESNPRPAFWISNAIHQMDPAFLRRFDMVVEMKGPDPASRERVAGALFDGIQVSADAVSQLGSQSDFEIGHIERFANVLKVMAPESAAEGGRILGVLERQLGVALGLPANKALSKPQLAYRADCVNADCDLQELVKSLVEMPIGRICLFGPPGTGKTQWVHELAKCLARPLLMRRASDLLDKYVGGTEARIREAFERAEKDGAVLLIDEADTFLQSRESVRASWEASMVNEMLVAMERFEGIFVASTNLQSRMDVASARRFDFKVEFRALDAKQAGRLFSDLLEHFGLPRDKHHAHDGLRELVGTTPGDFANVARQVRLMPSKRNPASLRRLLAKELEFRNDATGGRRIGFV